MQFGCSLFLIIIDLFSIDIQTGIYLFLVSLVSFLISRWEPWTRLYSCIKCTKLHVMNELLIHGDWKGCLLSKFRKEEKLSHLGILQTDLKRVKDIPLSAVKNNYICLLDNKDEDYETRKPITDKTRLEYSVNVIHDHYEQLQNKLKRNRWIDDPLFSIEYQGKLQHICDVMTQIYTLDTLWEAIKNVKEDIGTDGAIKFIGNKIGICGFSMEDKKDLLLHVYETDHFTFKVFKHIFKDERYSYIFRTLISRTNQTNRWEKKSLLVEALAFLFSSVGVDILIGGNDISGNKKLLVAARNGDIESDHISTLHIPVNESFSNTDVDGDVYSLTACVKRGIKEELGIPTEMIDNSQISFHDFAIVADEGEIGFGCYVDMSDKIPLEQCRIYPGQDKYMELNNIFVVPYPKFRYNPSDYEDIFYQLTNDDRFCMRWQSFAALIYQRAILRNEKTRFITSVIIETIIIIGIIQVLAVLLNQNCKDDVLSLITTGIVAILFYALSKIIKSSKKIRRKGGFKPFVPQWNGDCKVLQSTVDFLDDDIAFMLKDSRRFGLLLLEDSKSVTYHLSELSLAMPPFCTVRKKSHDYSEYPISFYYMEEGLKLGNGILKLIKIPYFEDANGIIALCLNIEKHKGIVKSIRFTEDYNDDIKLTFDKSFTTPEVEAYSRYYKLDKKILSKVKYATLEEEVLSEYKFFDLFSFDNTYYWSVSKNTMPKGTVCEINSRTTPRDVYERYILSSTNQERNDNNLDITRIILRGYRQDVERFICDFTARNDNRKRMNDLDLYAMQLFLIRKDLVFAKIIGKAKKV